MEDSSLRFNDLSSSVHTIHHDGDLSCMSMSGQFDLTPPSASKEKMQLSGTGLSLSPIFDDDARSTCSTTVATSNPASPDRSKSGLDNSAHSLGGSSHRRMSFPVNAPRKSDSSSCSHSRDDSSTHKQKPTIYKRVTYRGNAGTLVLRETRCDFIYHPTTTSVDPEMHKPQKLSWRWAAIKKHQVGVGDKNILKLVSAENEKCSVLFGMPNRADKATIRQDITHRLRHLRGEGVAAAVIPENITTQQMTEENLMKQAEEEAKKKADLERLRANELAARKKVTEELERQKAKMEAANKKAAEEAERLKVEEEAAIKKAAEAAERLRVEEEATKKKAAEEAEKEAANKKLAEEVEQQRKAREEEEASRKRAAEEEWCARVLEQRKKAEAERLAREAAAAAKREEAESRATQGEVDMDTLYEFERQSLVQPEEDKEEVNASVEGGEEENVAEAEPLCSLPSVADEENEAQTEESDQPKDEEVDSVCLEMIEPTPEANEDDETADDDDVDEDQSEWADPADEIELLVVPESDDEEETELEIDSPEGETEAVLELSSEVKAEPENEIELEDAIPVSEEEEEEEAPELEIGTPQDETEMVLEIMELEAEEETELTEPRELELETKTTESTKSDYGSYAASETKSESVVDSDTDSGDDGETPSFTKKDLTEATIDSEDSAHAVKEIAFRDIYSDHDDDDDLFLENKKKSNCGFFGFRLFC